MEEIYDQFPINLLEMGGKIEREPIGFMVHYVKIYLNGTLTERSKWFIRHLVMLNFIVK